MADTQLELDYTSVDLKLHEDKRVVAALTDALTISAVSDHDEYATVKVEDMNIIITPVGVGTANITVTAQAEEAEEATANITVNVTKEKLSLNDFTDTELVLEKEVVMTLDTNSDDYNVVSETPANVEVVKMHDTEHEIKQFKLIAKKIGTSRITVTATKDKYEEATDDFTVTVKDKPLTTITVDKLNLTLEDGDTDFINVTTNADSISATASDPEVLEVAEHNKQIRVTALKKAEDAQVITIKAQAEDHNAHSLTVSCIVNEKTASLIKEFTYLEIPESNIITRINKATVIKCITEPGATLSSNADEIDNLEATPAADNVSVTITQTGDYTLTIGAEASGKVKKTRIVKIKALPAFEGPGCDPIYTPDGGHNECIYGARAYKTKEQIMKEYVEKFKDYQNTSNLKLTSSVKITVFDKKSSGKLTTNVSCKDIIRNVIIGKYGNMKFINDSRAKSFIALVYGLTRADYGSNISINQKYDIIKYVVDGHGLKIDE